MGNKTREKALRWIFESEGGYVNHPNDPGGETKYGISKKSYPHLDIRNLTKEEAREIYIRDFWKKIRGDEISAPLNICVFDMAVNSGVDRAVRLLQSQIGAAEDGIVGPETLKYVKILDYDWRNFLWCRLDYYNNLKQAKYFLRGWNNRLIKLREYIESQVLVNW